MIDHEMLITLGQSGKLLDAWSVILYVILSSIFVLMSRISLYLLTTFVFTVYWGFVLYWAYHITGVSFYMTPLAVYTFCSLAIVCLVITSLRRGSRRRAEG